jgi:hypothetical protein
MSTQALGGKRRRNPPLQWVGHLVAGVMVLALVVLFPLAAMTVLPIGALAVVIYMRSGENWRRCQVFAVLLIAAIILFIGGIFLVWRVLENPPIVNPLLDGWLYLAFLLVLAALLAFAVLVADQGWLVHKTLVLQALARHLGFASEGEVPPAARAQILALVPCRGRRLRGALAALGGGRQLWLCFLPGRLLVIAARSGRSLEAPRQELDKLYLVESMSTETPGLILEDRQGRQSWLAVQRLDDFVRIVNVLIQQGVALRFREAPRWIDWSRYHRLWGVVRSLGLYELAGLVLVVFIVCLTKLAPPGKDKEREAEKSVAGMKDGPMMGGGPEPARLPIDLSFSPDGRLLFHDANSVAEINRDNAADWVRTWRGRPGGRNLVIEIRLTQNAVLTAERKAEIVNWFGDVPLDFKEP